MNDSSDEDLTQSLATALHAYCRRFGADDTIAMLDDFRATLEENRDRVQPDEE